MGKIIRSAIAVILAFMGILGSVQLLRFHSISEASFLFLVSLSCLIGLIIGFIERIKVLNLKDLKLTLYEIKETKSEVRLLALAVADLIEVSTEHSLVVANFDDSKFKSALKKVKEI